jgi:co-chaperonin GroES (HSP10)
MMMSELLISDAMGNVSQLPAEPAKKATQLPKAAGYHILCMVPEAQEEYESGILKSDTTMHYEEVLTPVLFVMDIGPDAYQDKARFPSGPLCKVGDFILTRPNSGSRVKIHGQEFRIVNDDSVEAIVQDPRGITRA